MPSLAQVSVSVQWGWGRNAYRAPITALSGTVKSLCACPHHHGPTRQSQRADGKSVWELTPGPTPPPTRALRKSGAQV